MEIEWLGDQSLVQSLADLDQKRRHDGAQLRHLGKQRHHLALRSQKGRREPTVVWIHIPGVSPYIVTEGVEDGHNMLNLRVIASQKILCVENNVNDYATRDSVFHT